jgi:hypothetical protein
VVNGGARCEVSREGLQQNVNLKPKQLAPTVTLLTCFWKVPGLSLGCDTCYSVWGVSILLRYSIGKPVPLAARSKIWVCGRSPTEIVGSNPTGGMYVVSVVCCHRSLRRADHLPRGVLLNVVRHCVWPRNLMDEEALAHWVSYHAKNKNVTVISNASLRFVHTHFWWSNSRVPSFTTAMIYGLLCLLSLSNESKMMPRPTHLSELPNTCPSYAPLDSVYQNAYNKDQHHHYMTLH